MRSPIHPFVPSARATSPCNPAKSAQQFPCQTEANCRPQTLLPNLSEETFLLPDGFLTELDPQIRPLTLPNFGVNSTNRLHWEGFPRLAWEALSAAGYLTPPTYEVSEFECYGVPRCTVIVTVLPHPDHADWFDLSFIYWGFITHEVIESAALIVLTDFCDHNPTVVALSPFGLFPAMSPHDLAWLDRMDHLRELLSLAEPLDVSQTLTRCLNVVFTLQGLRYNTAAIIGQRLEASGRDWQ
jgi:hypothetical protein